MGVPQSRRRQKPPGHWSQGCRGFAGGFADLAGGLDGLAEAAGAADGLVLIGKLFGAGPAEVAAASRAQAKDWFYRAYAQLGEGPSAGAGADVVGSRSAMWSPSGWDRP